MNNKLLLLILSLLLSFQLAAQEGFNAGVQLGMTATQVTGDKLSGFKKAGLFGGVFVNRNFSTLGTGQMEINFIQKGSRKNAKPDDGIYDSYLMRLNYVEVPVFFRFNLKKPLGVEVGLQFAYLISGKEFDENGEFYPDPSVPNFKKFDFSGFVGLNYRINEAVGFTIRYSYSILPIRPKPDNVQFRYDGGQFNEVICTALQYNF